jgi:hypothetical protein
VRELELVRHFTLVTRADVIPAPAVSELISYLLGALTETSVEP